MGQRSESMWTVWKTHIGYALSSPGLVWWPLWAMAPFFPGKLSPQCQVGLRHFFLNKQQVTVQQC